MQSQLQKSSRSLRVSSGKENPLSEVENILKEFQDLTTNLDGKLNSMLKIQQSQFVDSYRQHLVKMKEVFQSMQLQLDEKNMKIDYYENENTIGDLLKRIMFLEKEEKKMMEILKKRNDEIKRLKISNEIQSNQNLKLDKTIKKLLQSKADFQKTKDRSLQKIVDTGLVFATEISQLKKNTSLLKSIQQKQKLQLETIKKQRSFRSDTTISASSPGIQRQKQLRRQINILKKDNQELKALNEACLLERSSTQKFFMQILAELKKNVTLRKRMPVCTFEDFSKQDKLELLVKVLSNNEIMIGLYHLIFQKKANSEFMPSIGDVRKKSMVEKQKQHSRELFFKLNQTSNLLD